MADEIINYERDFEAIVKIIETAKLRAMKAVNAELIDMYLVYKRKNGIRRMGQRRCKSVCRLFAKEVSCRKRSFLAKYLANEAVLRNLVFITQNALSKNRSIVQLIVFYMRIF